MSEWNACAQTPTKNSEINKPLGSVNRICSSWTEEVAGHLKASSHFSSSFVHTDWCVSSSENEQQNVLSFPHFSLEKTCPPPVTGTRLAHFSHSSRLRKRRVGCAKPVRILFLHPLHVWICWVCALPWEYYGWREKSQYCFQNWNFSISPAMGRPSALNPWRPSCLTLLSFCVFMWAEVHMNIHVVARGQPQLLSLRSHPPSLLLGFERGSLWPELSSRLGLLPSEPRDPPVST